MKQAKIELIDDYFIEVDELNHTLKKRYMATDKKNRRKETCRENNWILQKHTGLRRTFYKTCLPR